jgi:serine protease AprX
MSKYLFYLIILTPIILLSQDKYFIYFKDKGIKQNETLLKSSATYLNAISLLTDRSIERRKKVMNEDELITFEDLPLKEEYIGKIQSLGIKIQNRLKWFNAVTAYLTNEQINQVYNSGCVDKIEKVNTIFSGNINEFKHTSGLENKFTKVSTFDYGSSYDQYALSGIPNVHNKGINGQGVIIGILDSGFDRKTPESLSGIKVIAEHDFVFNDNNTANESNDVPGQDSHGTAILSIIGGNKPGEIIGPSYNASFILAKTENIASETHQEEDNYAAALEWMENLGVDITGSSVGYNIFDKGQGNYTYKDMDGKTTIITKAAELAFQRGVLVVNSAGNEGDNSWKYIIAPADGFNVIAVGAVNNYNQVASFSSRGPTYDGRIKPDVLAQGVHIYCALAHTANGYTYGQGTSDASPITSGIAGLLLSASPYLNNMQLRNILLKASDNYSIPDNDRGYGLLSASKAVSYPNLERNGNTYIFHKIFLDSIDFSSVHLYMSKNFQKFSQYNFGNLDSIRYLSILPNFQSGDVIQLYLNYTDKYGNLVREPEGNYNYTFIYGSFDINIKINQAPFSYELKQNYPNPFNNGTTIEFEAVERIPVKLNILNSLGQRVKTFSIDNTIIGKNLIFWNGTDDDGLSCSSGIYFYSLTVGENIFNNKMVLLK